MLRLWKAAHTAQGFVVSARRDGGAYELEWPRVKRKFDGRSRGAPYAVVRLRVAERMLMGFLDPVEDALFVTAGLNSLGYPASFHLGRETAPVVAPGGFYAWVQCGGSVVTTSLPVREEYTEVLRTGGRGLPC
ncbi:lasso peptide biosynthesis protein [Streptomyces sp. H27-C3]|nr:lasso peptide biosynthesis protein [Streptomyces sp. H27-C3]MDJ0460323.1 lasso peptide biosynthesis protein [Streptomyces sp. H27-C3]